MKQTYPRLGDLYGKVPLHLGEVVRYFREQDGLNREQLSREAGVTAQTISNFEDGAYLPSADTFLRVCRAVRIKPVDAVAEETVKKVCELKYLHSLEQKHL